MASANKRDYATLLFAVLAALLVGCAAWLLLHAANPFGLATSPDSIQYLDIAYHLKNGDGWGASDFRFETVLAQHSESKTLPLHLPIQPERAWPPLYPLLLATVINDPFDTVNALTLNSALFAAFAVFTLLTLRHCLPLREPLLRNGIAALLTIMILLSTPVMTCFSHVWSEAPFLTLTALYLYMGITLSSPLTTRYLVIVGLLCVITVLLFFTRYIGIVYFGSTLLFIVLNALNKTARAQFIASLVILLLCGLLAAGLIIDNITTTGFASGVLRNPASESLYQVLQDSLESLRIALPADNVTLIIGLMSGLIIGLITAYVATQHAHDAQRPKLSTTGSWISFRKRLPALLPLLFTVACGAGYLSFLMLSRSVQHFDAINTRLTAPFITIAVMAITLLGYTLMARGRPTMGSLSYGLSVALISLMGWHGYTHFTQVNDAWLNDSSPRYAMNGTATYRNLSPVPNMQYIYDPLKYAVSGAGILITDRPSIWHFLLRVPTAAPIPIDSTQAITRLNQLPKQSALFMNVTEFKKLLTDFGTTYEIKAAQVAGSMVVPLPLIPKTKTSR